MKKSFFSVGQEDSRHCAAIFSFVGAAVGLASAAHPTPDWRNEAFGPICGVLFWEYAGHYIGSLLDKGIRIAAYRCRLCH
ncbi:MAG TPA: hypothetical protein VN665_03980 [Candidatus Paceibacterota bacterium]|nr:hypothetical protein [Candidatus Paceibacterota bacterium]